MSESRPLTGEPLALDLLNTEWFEDRERHDLLSDEQGLEEWLSSIGADAPVNQRTLAALVEARAAIRAVLDGGGRQARGDLNAVLARGRIVLSLTSEGPRALTEAAAEQELAWQAARNLLELLEGSASGSSHALTPIASSSSLIRRETRLDAGVR